MDYYRNKWSSKWMGSIFYLIIGYMKQYIKNNEIKTRQQIVIVKDGMRTINPSEEMIYNDGWVEYITPQYIEDIDHVRNRKIHEIEDYDSSPEVNEFFVNGLPVWLDKATRVGLVLRFQSEKAVGKSVTTLWYNGIQFSMLIELGEQILCAIENYASACYDNTQLHLSVLSTLQTIEEIESYDHTTGYPEKLNFNL